jgi:hypothetical protein
MRAIRREAEHLPNKPRRRSMEFAASLPVVKSISAALVLVLTLPSTVMAQSVPVPRDHVASVRLRSLQPTIRRQGPFTREALPPMTVRSTQTTPAAQPPPERNWAGRHPTVLGAMIGAATGAVVGAVPCWKTVCGDGHGPLIVAFGAGLGAGIGAGVGFTISLARR